MNGLEFAPEEVVISRKGAFGSQSGFSDTCMNHPIHKVVRIRMQTSSRLVISKMASTRHGIPTRVKEKNINKWSKIL